MQASKNLLNTQRQGNYLSIGNLTALELKKGAANNEKVKTNESPL